MVMGAQIAGAARRVNPAPRPLVRTGVAALVALAVACGGEPPPPSSRAPAGDTTADVRDATCPATAPAPTPLPDVAPQHRTAAYWVDRVRATQGDPDAALLDAEAVAAHRAALSLPADDGQPLGQADLREPVDPARLEAAVNGRLAAMRERLATGVYVGPDGEPAGPDLLAFLDPRPLPPLAPTLRRATAVTSIRCGPLRAPLLKAADPDPDFDRNACSAAHPGEVIQVLADYGAGMRLVRTRYALGFLPADAPLSAPVAEDAAAPPPPAATLTRRAVLEAAFARLGEPYGWGGRDGHPDCSRFLMDLFDGFGLGLPRHSARQARAGTFSIDVAAMDDLGAKALLLDSAARRGVVLLHFPGHVMLYLGRDDAGAPMAIHAFSEYVEPCPGGGETLRRADRVAVSTLALGAGSSRGSFLERLTTVTVIGAPPGPELRGVATPRRAAPPSVPEGDACRDDVDHRIFDLPALPNPEQPLRVVVTTSDDPGPAALRLLTPAGESLAPPTKRLGGPPFALVAEVPSPARGVWTAVLGDGPRVLACKRFRVLARRPRAWEVFDRDDPAVWTPRWRWEADTENLFAAFVEQLFDAPLDDRTWPSLQALVGDPERNLLYDHLGQREDDDLSLEPDCADLPYYLRGYFAWKLRLPFAYRRCTRGRGDRPPRCGELRSHLEPGRGVDPVTSASIFLRRDVKSGVHSASARTLPTDDDTDVYPVPLARRHLAPGTVFADPYGHLLVVAKWVPQGLDGAGALIGADAQPDGTVGRRRFWRGSFLFTPATDEVGAGFHAWRPVVFDPREGTVDVPDNRALARPGAAVHPYSRDQYAGSREDFYARMEALISPRPLPPEGRLRALVDAFGEQVERRVVSVDNGEAYLAGARAEPIEMPDGARIFLTSGPWEDFSTPSRDLRLLIAMDAVTGFPARVAGDPARFGVPPARAAETAAALEAALRDALAARAFTYTRSDGTPWTLTLLDVVERARALELAWNPNDCVEIRWGAPDGSDERATCRRRAPADQRSRMAEVRDWFRTRSRPAR